VPFEPASPAPVTCKSDAPTFRTWIERGTERPTWTGPNSQTVGAPSMSGDVDATPHPRSATSSAGSSGSFVSIRSADPRRPTVDGSKLTTSSRVSPGASTAGAPPAASRKSAASPPVTVAAASTSAPAPSLRSWTDAVADPG